MGQDYQESKRETFARSFTGLGNNFGVRGQTLEDRLDIFWEEFHAINLPLWKSACKFILENDERFPTIKRMKEALNDLSRSLIPDHAVPKVPCSKCEGSGIISTAKKYDQTVWGEYSWRCDCQNGALLSKHLPLWEGKWINKGHLLREEWEEIFYQQEYGNKPADLKSMLGQIGKPIPS